MHSVTASNLFKYCQPAHGLVLFKHHQPLEFSLAQLSDLLNTARGWFDVGLTQPPCLTGTTYTPLVYTGSQCGAPSRSAPPAHMERAAPGRRLTVPRPCSGAAQRRTFPHAQHPSGSCVHVCHPPRRQRPGRSADSGGAAGPAAHRACSKRRDRNGVDYPRTGTSKGHGGGCVWPARGRPRLPRTACSAVQGASSTCGRTWRADVEPGSVQCTTPGPCCARRAHRCAVRVSSCVVVNRIGHRVWPGLCPGASWRRWQVILGPWRCLAALPLLQPTHLWLRRPLTLFLTSNTHDNVIKQCVDA